MMMIIAEVIDGRGMVYIYNLQFDSNWDIVHAKTIPLPLVELLTNIQTSKQTVYNTSKTIFCKLNCSKY